VVVCRFVFFNVWVCVCVGFVICGFCSVSVRVFVSFVMRGCVYVRFS